jgi:GNAT superfamily N-acetyltransferase
MTELRVEPAGLVHLPGLCALFEAASSTCYCRYWHFAGTKNEWLDRCANRPEENAAEMEVALSHERQGVVALRGGELVGWMKMTTRAAVPKLRRLPVYRSLDLGDDAGTLSIGCFLVHPSARGSGVARALVGGALEIARAWGAAQVEAYPRRSADRLHPEEAWQGPERLFLDAGFRPVHDIGPYPVYRLVL